MPGSVPPAPNFAQIITEVVYYLSLALPIGIGMTVAVLAVPESRGGVVAATVRRLALPTAVFVAVAAVGLLLSTAAGFAHTGIVGALDPGVLKNFLASEPARGNTGGRAALVQLAGFAAVVIGLLVLRGRTLRWPAAAIVAITCLIALIPVKPTSLGALPHNALTYAHILGALFWVGGLIVLATAGLLDRRHGDPAAAGDWAQVWERFGVVALFAVGALIVSGTWLSWLHVGTVGQLFSTAYGRALAVKLVLVLALLTAGAYNMRVLLPRIRAELRAGATESAFRLAVKHFPVVVAGEAVVAVAVLVVVPFLRGSARTEAGWPAARGFDLTVFGSGVLLVALTALALWAGTRQGSRDTLEP